MTRLLLLSAFAISTLNIAAQNIWYVNAASTAASPDGHSWATAFRKLQKALAVAHYGDEVWVAQGQYKPTDDNDRSKSFNLVDGVAVFGGFNGTESSRGERDWTVFPTVLSGDIGAVGDSSDNSYTILYAVLTSFNTRLDGFTIENGNASLVDLALPQLNPQSCGGAIYLNGYGDLYAYLSIYNCTFRNDWAIYSGGAICANGRDGGSSVVYLENCVFEHDYATTYGGAILLENSSTQPYPLTIRNCVFDSNRTEVEGGALWIKHHQKIEFKGCDITNNITELGNIILAGKYTSFPISFDHCRFIKNDEFHNGAGSCFRVETDFPTIINEEKSVTLNGCSFLRNSKTLMSFNFYTNIVKYKVSQCIFSENGTNTSYFIGILSCSGDTLNSKTEITNCAFYNNHGPEIASNPKAFLKNSIIVDFNDNFNSLGFPVHDRLTLDNCIVSYPGLQVLQQIFGQAASHNVQYATDPLFINPGTDFHLQPCSPAINAGLDDILDSLGITTDLDGLPRVSNGRVDIGPYEKDLHLEPTTLLGPTCAGAHDGLVRLGGDVCNPYTVQWNNGTEIGQQLDSLASGVYALSITNANGVVWTDTLEIPETPPLVFSAQATNISCPGEQNGSVQLFVSGGAPGYYFSPFNPPLEGLAAGSYDYYVADVNGCAAQTQVSIAAPPPFEIHYQVIPASGPDLSDGAIVIDSITGGWQGIPAPGNILHLHPGDYAFTFTDATGCAAVLNATVGFTSAANEPEMENPVVIYPNPAVAGTPVFMKLKEPAPVEVSLLDACGRLCFRKESISARMTLDVPGAGVYWVVMKFRDSGRVTRTQITRL